MARMKYRNGRSGCRKLTFLAIQYVRELNETAGTLGNPRSRIHCLQDRAWDLSGDPSVAGIDTKCWP